MKIKTEINQKKNVRVHIVTGKFDVDVLFNSLKDMYSDLPLQADMNVLWDLRNVEGISKTATSQLDKVSALVSKKWGNAGKSKAALVISRQVDYGFVRIYEQRLENQTTSKVRVFKDIKKAAQWIDQGAMNETC